MKPELGSALKTAMRETHNRQGGNYAKAVVRRRLKKNGLFRCGIDLTNRKVPRRMNNPHWPRVANVIQRIAVTESMELCSNWKIKSKYLL
jgi:hypothetical protein